MILLSSLMLLVAGVTVVACVTAAACIQTVAGTLAVAGVLFKFLTLIYRPSFLENKPAHFQSLKTSVLCLFS
jgi:hypothetical protein